MMRIRLAEDYVLKFYPRELQVPDGMGSWSIEEDGTILFDGLFLMFVENISPTKNDACEINGTILDVYGKANFHGSFGTGHPKNFIEFVKEYDDDALSRLPEHLHESIKYRGYLTYDDPHGKFYEGNYSRGGEPRDGSRLRFCLRLKI